MNTLKWILGLLLATNLILLATIQWGADVTGEDGVAQSQSQFNAEKIKLLNAPAALPDTAMKQPVETEPGVSAATAQTSVCMEWGEFSGNDLSRATEALAAMNLGDRIVQHQAEHDAGYWVYMPPLSSRADVDKKIRQLKALGVTDYFVVQDATQWLNAISLGIFKTEDAARLFLDRMKAKGVHSAVMGKRDGTLKFTVFDLKNLDPALTEKMSSLQKQFADSDLKVVPCSSANAN